MAGVTKGKNRITLDMEPEALKALDAFVEMSDGSRGPTIDSLVKLFISLDPAVCVDLYSYCQDQIANKRAAILAENNGILRQSLEQQLYTYQTLAQHFAKLIPAEDSATDLSAIGCTHLELADGRVELVPLSMAIMNPQDAPICKNMYIAWFMDAENPVDQNQAWQGESLDNLYGFASNRSDLHEYGQKQATFKSKEEQRACRGEAMTLIKFLLSQVARIFNENEGVNALQYAWTELSNIGISTSQIGLSSIIQRKS